MPSILIVDDVVSLHEMLAVVIQHTGITTSFATDGETALARYKAEKYDLVLADIDMKPMDGITLLQEIKLYNADAVVVMMTAYASTASAVQALKFGAFDYLLKPFRIDEFVATLRRGVAFGRRAAEHASGKTAAARGTTRIEERVIGRSPGMLKLIAHVKKLTPGRAPVLLLGERGTGKRLVAEIVHAAAGGSDANFVRIDCSLGSEANLRAGLFGAGGGGPWLDQARGGTVLLQHVQDLSEPLQKALAGMLRTAGHSHRLICTAGQNFEQIVEEGKFFDELFYRVASFPIRLPPLRDRREDLPLLVRHFAGQAVNAFVEPRLVEFDAGAMAAMTAYPWPGNLSELRQVVSMIAATTETRSVTAHQLPWRLRPLAQWLTLSEHLAVQGKRYEALVLRAGQDRAAAAWPGPHALRLAAVEVAAV